MIKVSRLADYAVVVLATLAKSNGQLLSAAGVAEQTRLPEPTVAKVLKLLAREQIISSIRGANGGYKLSRNTHQINVAEVVAAVDGPISLTACVEGSNESCGYACQCPVKGRWDEVNMAIRHALESVSLDEMIGARPAQANIKNKESVHEHI